MGVKKYTQEVIKEGKRVRWPKKDEFLPALITVIVVCVICALVLSLWDWAAGSLIKQLKDLFSSMKGSTPSSSEVPAEILRLFIK